MYVSCNSVIFTSKDLKLEKQRASELEERIRILEDCVKQQEKIIQEKETENMESTEDSNKRVENERQVNEKKIYLWNVCV